VDGLDSFCAFLERCFSAARSENQGTFEHSPLTAQLGQFATKLYSCSSSYLNLILIMGLKIKTRKSLFPCAANGNPPAQQLRRVKQPTANFIPLTSVLNSGFHFWKKPISCKNN